MAKLIVKERFGVIPQSVLYCETLSFKAKGLYGYMQSKPDGWDFSADRISYETKESRDSILAGLKELKEHGLLTVQKVKNGLGRWEWEHVLSENPSLDFPSLEVSSLEKSTNKQEVSSKKEVVKSIHTSESKLSRASSEKKATFNPAGAEVVHAFFEVNPTAKKWYGNTTQRGACDELIDAHGLERVLQVVGILNKTNSTPYMPTITTPLQLRDKWAALGAALQKQSTKTAKFNVAVV